VLADSVDSNQNAWSAGWGRLTVERAKDPQAMANSNRKMPQKSDRPPYLMPATKKKRGGDDHSASARRPKAGKSSAQRSPLGADEIKRWRGKARLRTSHNRLKIRADSQTTGRAAAGAVRKKRHAVLEENGVGNARRREKRGEFERRTRGRTFHKQKALDARAAR